MNRMMRCSYISLYLLVFVAGLCQLTGAKAACGQANAKSANQSDRASFQVATGRKWIHRDQQAIQVLVGDQTMALDYYTDLLIVTMSDAKTSPDKLVGQAIAIVRDPKRKDQWDAFLEAGGGAGGESLVLAGNILRVHRALAATEKNRVSVQVDGEKNQLKPGEVLLVLG